jgi:guanine deaminase
MSSPLKILRGFVWHCLSDPSGFSDPTQALSAIEHGAIAIGSDGRILQTGEYSSIFRAFPDAEIQDFGHCVIAPGFVDAHTHFPQLDMIGSYGETLLGWLNKYTFPEEAKFANQAVAQHAAERFVDALLANGTTTATIFSSSHRNATEALCAEVSRRGIRAVIGKSSMNRNASPELLVDLEQEIDDLQALFDRWHAYDDRIFCAITPRFAPSCTDELLIALGRLRLKYPGVYVQSHVSENPEEISLVRELFPKDRDYFGVYERFGLVGERCIYAHGIHLSESELGRIASTGTSLAHCPSSNLFLGSGLFRLADANDHGIDVALGTDVGAGTTFSMPRTMLDAYKVQKLQHHAVHPVELFYLATLGGAKALRMDKICGNFASGKAADVVVIDWQEGSLLSERMNRSSDPTELLFALATLADDRNIKKVFVQGQPVYERAN